MKNQDETRAEFEVWWTQDTHLSVSPLEVWQSCQQLNDERIAAKDAEIAMLRDDLMTIIYGATKALEATND
jgi:hypothetical protein